MLRDEKPFRYFDSSPEVIRLVVMIYFKYPLSLRNVILANMSVEFNMNRKRTRLSSRCLIKYSSPEADFVVR
jgi:transposase-like protein